MLKMFWRVYNNNIIAKNIPHILIVAASRLEEGINIKGKKIRQ